MNRLFLPLVATLTLLGGCGGPGASRRAAPPAEVTSAASPPVGTGRAQLHRAAGRALEATADAHFEWGLVDGRDVRDVAALDGDLWLATAGGLLRYRDGLLVERVTRLDGLRHNAVRSLFEDGSDRLWLAFDEGGCQVLEPGRLSDCPPELRAARITSFARHQGRPVAVTWDGELLWPGNRTAAARAVTHKVISAGVMEDDAQAPLRPLADAPSPLRAHRLASCGGHLWTATRGHGLYARSGGEWHGVPSPPIIDELVCHRERLYAGTVEGLLAVEPDGTSHRVPLASVSRRVTLLETLGDDLLVGFADGGAWRLREEGTDLIEVAQPVTSARQVDDVLWLAGPGLLMGVSTRGGDVVEPRRIELSLPGPGSTDVSAIAGHGDRLALGLFRHGVALWSAGRWHGVGRADGLPSDEINGLSFDASGALWVATSHGLARIEVDGDTDGRVSHVVRAPVAPCDHMNAVVTPELLGPVVVASSCGVGWIDPIDGQVTRWEGRQEGLPHRHVYAVGLWHGQLVAGTNDGLAVRDAVDPDHPWTVYRAGRTSLTDNWITAVTALPDGRLAVGTYSGGLYVGTDPTTLRRLEQPRYVNLGALTAFDGRLFAGGLSEGARVVDALGSAARIRRECLMGDDVTGFAAWGTELLVATRSGVAPLAPGCVPVD